MAKKKNKGMSYQRWEEYFNEDELSHWQRLMAILGIDGYFPSKTQCKKALKGVWVNIREFLYAVTYNESIPRYQNRRALARHTESTGKYYARRKIVSGSPLAALMANIDN